MNNFLETIRQSGLTPPDHIKPGKFYRFPGLDKSRKNKAGWCKLFADGRGGIYGDYSTGLKETWQERREYTATEKREFKQRVEAERKREAAKETAQKDRQKEKALKEREAACAVGDPGEVQCLKREGNSHHPYLAAKGIKSHGLRTDGRNLLIPLQDINGAFQGMQWIGERGHKGFAKGSQLQGSYFPIGKISDRLFICEGYATGATVHEVTGYSVAVAFNAGNLKAVAEALRGRYPDLNIFIAADNDEWTEGNPGLRCAREAAKAAGAQLVIPRFKDVSTQPTDFNDLYQLEGAEKVKEQINNVAFMHGGGKTYEWPEPKSNDYIKFSYDEYAKNIGDTYKDTLNNIKIDPPCTSYTSVYLKGYRGDKGTLTLHQRYTKPTPKHHGTIRAILLKRLILLLAIWSKKPKGGQNC